jgi:hypothetical protein
VAFGVSEAPGPEQSDLVTTHGGGREAFYTQQLSTSIARRSHQLLLMAQDQRRDGMQGHKPLHRQLPGKDRALETVRRPPRQDIPRGHPSRPPRPPPTASTHQPCFFWFCACALARACLEGKLAALAPAASGLMWRVL